MDPVTCIFCTPGPDDIILENEYVYARYDKYPVSPGHLLVLPKRHIPSIFHTTEEEMAALWKLVQ